jgi:hypothetical protein
MPTRKKISPGINTRSVKFNNRSGLNPKIKPKINPKTKYVIFDMDGTLISVDIKNDMQVDKNQLPADLITTNAFINSAGVSVEQSAYIRPNIPELLADLASRSDVRIGIWTTSFRNYSEGIARILFGPDYRNKLFCFLSTDEINGQRVAYDILNNRYLTNARIIDKKVCKDLQLLFDDTIYGQILNRGNTLLVDDLPMHKLNNLPAVNRRLVYTIRRWEPEDPVSTAAILKNPSRDYQRIYKWLGGH